MYDYCEKIIGASKNKNKSWPEPGYSEKTSVVVKIVVGIEIVVMIVAKEQHTPAPIM